ncbi:MAG TPA: hypothetical protein VK590_15745 [Saprospiraceae bacterium]|nr:hypothetical protein [Saprospiraceae bacterium]
MKNQSITITPENLNRYFSKSYSTCIIYQDEISIEVGKKKGMQFTLEDFNLSHCNSTEDIVKYINQKQNNTIHGNQLILNFPVKLV